MPRWCATPRRDARRVGPYTESVTSRWSPAEQKAHRAMVMAESPDAVTTVSPPPSIAATASAVAAGRWLARKTGRPEPVGERTRDTMKRFARIERGRK